MTYTQFFAILTEYSAKGLGFTLGMFIALTIVGMIGLVIFILATIYEQKF